MPIAGVQHDPDIATLPQGGYVVVFVDENAPTSDGSGSAVRARFVSAAGMPGTVVTVNSTTAGDQTQPAITALPDGRVFVAWTDAVAPKGLVAAAARCAADSSTSLPPRRCPTVSSCS